MIVHRTRKVPPHTFYTFPADAVSSARCGVNVSARFCLRYSFSFSNLSTMRYVYRYLYIIVTEGAISK